MYVIFLFALVFFEFLSLADFEQFEPIHLNRNKIMKFYANKTILCNNTCGRRERPIHQLFCVNHTSFKLCIPSYELDFMTCENENYDTDIDEPKWECNDKKLDTEVAFERMKISCENYMNTTAVIKGSCYLNYTLKYSFNHNDKSVNLVELLAIILFSIIVFVVLTGAFCSNNLACLFGDHNFRENNSERREPINTISGQITTENELTSIIDHSSSMDNYSTSFTMDRKFG